MNGIENTVLRKSFSFLSELIVNRILIVSIVINNICSIHLTQDDYLNHLPYIIKREYCFLQKTQLSFGILEEIELLQRKFQGIKSIKIDHFDQERAGEETLEEVNWTSVGERFQDNTTQSDRKV